MTDATPVGSFARPTVLAAPGAHRYSRIDGGNPKRKCGLMNKLTGGLTRLAATGLIAAGGIFVPAALAGAQSDCGQASPSDTTCTPPSEQGPVVENEVLTSNQSTGGNNASGGGNSASGNPEVGELAFTGSDTAQLAALGAGALLLGAGSVVVSRRRHARD